MKTKLLFSVTILFLYSLLSGLNCKAQSKAGSDCSNATQLCTAVGNSYSFPNQTTSIAQVGPDYDCLGTQPNPAWFYIQTSAADITDYTISQTSLTGGNDLDVDFIAWGPFSTMTNACNGLTGNIVDCSYSTSSTETLTIQSQGAGQFYIILITNYSGQPGNITFAQTYGPPTLCTCFAYYTTEYDSIQNTFNLTVNSPTTANAAEYLWDFGDGTTSTLATPNHIYTVDSLYNVCMTIYTTSGDSCTYCHIIGIDSTGNVTNKGGFALNIYNSITTGVLQYNNDIKISVSPNPSSGVIIVKVDPFEILKIKSIEVCNVLGEKIFFTEIRDPLSEIDLSSQPEGVYFINVKTDQGNYCKKIILRK